MLRTLLALASFALVVSSASLVLVGCGGRVAGDDSADAADRPDVGDVPDVPVALADFTRCDEHLLPSWTVACDGSPSEHGQLCATTTYLSRCSALSADCSGSTVEDIVLGCDSHFYSRPGAKLAVDFDTVGCTSSIEWSGVPATVAQCVADRVTIARYACVGSVALFVPCGAR